MNWLHQHNLQHLYDRCRSEHIIKKLCCCVYLEGFSSGKMFENTRMHLNYHSPSLPTVPVFDWPEFFSCDLYLCPGFAPLPVPDHFLKSSARALQPARPQRVRTDQRYVSIPPPRHTHTPKHTHPSPSYISAQQGRPGLYCQWKKSAISPLPLGSQAPGGLRTA